MLPEGEDALPSLSDWHDYEPNLEFDDTELHPTASEESELIIVCVSVLFFGSILDESTNYKMY